jgi:hypothetical protein
MKSNTSTSGDIKTETQTTGTTTATPENENEEKSAWLKFCRKRKINPNLFMLKCSLFLLHGGEYEKKKRNGSDLK